MKMFSLRTVIDDILLIVRNNNISESEDLSRGQIAAWVSAYKASILKREADKAKETGDDEDDDSLETTIGPLELENVIDENDTTGGICIRKKKTKNKVPEMLGSSDNCIVTIDGVEEPIQRMNESRRHFLFYRRYTFGEPTFYYEDGYFYIQGYEIDDINSISVTGTFAEDPEADSEDDVMIPGWMIPEIKKLIMSNELSFMLGRPSDDDNNSTLDGIKPHGPQDQEK